jgi:hypothetical protein
MEAPGRRAWILHSGRQGPERRVGNAESGWTLVELLVGVLLFFFVLTAILSIADGTNRLGAIDNERSNTIGEAQTGLARIADDLRNACLLFGANGSASAGYYCGQNFSQALGTSACTRSSDCIDAILDARTAVTRPAGSVSRPLVRVRISCGVVDPASATQTECARYAAACISTSCPSPTALTGVVVRSLTNSGAAGAPTNVFVYCTRETLASAGVSGCSATPATADAVQVSVAVARWGQRRVSGGGSFLLQEGVELKNIDADNS